MGNYQCLLLIMTLSILTSLHIHISDIAKLCALAVKFSQKIFQNFYLESAINKVLKFQLFLDNSQIIQPIPEQMNFLVGDNNIYFLDSFPLFTSTKSELEVGTSVRI